MLRKIRIVLATVFFFFITLLFLDFTGTIHTWMGWMAKIQFLPALLALNFGIVVALILLTLIFGRVYCSVICPMGVFQDLVSWVHGKTKKKNKYRFSYSPAKTWLRYTVLIHFIVALVAGAGSVAALIAPYSSYGRIASNLFAPVYAACNNVLAYFAERLDSYAFYTTDIWIKSIPTFIIAAVTFIIIVYLAWRSGRTYCNTICPVGTVLGIVSKYSFFKMTIDTDKCRNCGLCGKQCKASCINMKEHEIDGSRCVVCMDCIGACKEGAVKYRFSLPWKKPGKHADKTLASADKTSAGADKTAAKKDGNDNGRRAFITSSAIVVSAAALKAQDIKIDGGLAPVIKKQAPERETVITPAGSLGHRHFYRHCTACQLCVSACPNHVLRPSSDLDRLMQPEMSYERGFCNPGCTQCSQVCPAGAIHKIGKEEKSSIQIGHAVVNLDLCVVNRDDVSCGNCAVHCPAGAIKMVNKNPDDRHSHRIPTVNTERCIGCGICEYLCPSRPISAIHVEGNEIHREI